ncbi:MAG: hypothetical protein HY805_00215 [Nitrospirae bacterium]|nr:hypothetical protein [Nitrospirota bacterium]
MNDWLKEISINDLPEIYQEVARIVGLENAVRLSEIFKGQVVYFPMLESLIRAKRDEAIKREFNGKNYRELARKYGISGKQLIRILTGKGR